MSRTISEIDKENIAPVQTVEKANLQEQIRKLYVEELKHADGEGRKLFSEVQTKQEEISYLQKVVQGINAAVSDKGDLDLSKNPELTEMLKEAEKRYGLKVPADKKYFVSQEWQRLLVDSTKSLIEDGNAQVQLKLNEVNRVNNKLSEIIKIFDSILKGLHHAIEEVIRGIR